MRRIVLIAFLLLASLACNILTRPTPTAPPTATRRPVDTATRVPTEAASPTASDEPVPATSEPVATATQGVVPTADLDPDIREQMEELEAFVIETRGLQPTGAVPIALLTPDELRQRVIDDFMSDYTPDEVRDDVIELVALGLIEPGFDLHTFYIDLLSEQIAGFYDSEVGEMFIVQGAGFGGPERLTYTHEFVHVLQDQNYDIENGLGYTDEACEADTERCAAIQALMEGDASSVEYTWLFSGATQEDYEQILDFYNTFESPVYESAPAFMQEDFIFPYTYGLEFVQALIDENGYAAVEDAYRNPPVSTEQILHPERYPADTPIPVELPGLLPVLGDGWRELERNVMGEWYTYLILARSILPQARLDDETAFTAAEGWGGDTYLVYHHDATSATALVMSTQWESNADAREFQAAFQQYADLRFGVSATRAGDSLSWTFADGYCMLNLAGDQTTWILAPDAATAQAIWTAAQDQ